MLFFILIIACILTIGFILEETVIFLQNKKLTYPGKLVKLQMVISMFSQKVREIQL